jgi:1-deoxy-D-xylulose-5-phosphate synthase
MDTPTAVRYPRGSGPGVKAVAAMQVLPVGRGEVRRTGKKIAILAFGSMLAPAMAAAEKLDASVVNMRFVKPLDSELVLRMAGEHSLLVTVEENTVHGGAGSAVAECLAQNGVLVQLLQLGLPDRFIEQGDPARLLAECGLDASGIEATIRSKLPE